jgi:hypothetical protein
MEILLTAFEYNTSRKVAAGRSKEDSVAQGNDDDLY